MKPDMPADAAERSHSSTRALVTRRRLLAGAGGVLGSSAVGTAAYAGGVEAQSLKVTRYAPQPAAWPKGQRLSITVIADIHAGGPNMTVSRVRRVVDTANELKSDLVVLLGDYIATYRFVNARMPNKNLVGGIGAAHGPLGTWAVLGNHDWWQDAIGIRTSLNAVGIPVLENDAVRSDRTVHSSGSPGSAISAPIVLGMGAFVASMICRERWRKSTTDDPVVLLAHEPDIFARMPARVALTLAGHTHGGQIRLPLIWPAFVPSIYGARYAYGHIVEDGGHMIVSGGLGTSFIPARLGVPPEVVQVVLGA